MKPLHEVRFHTRNRFWSFRCLADEGCGFPAVDRAAERSARECGFLDGAFHVTDLP